MAPKPAYSVPSKVTFAFPFSVLRRAVVESNDAQYVHTRGHVVCWQAQSYMGVDLTEEFVGKKITKPSAVFNADVDRDVLFIS